MSVERAWMVALVGLVACTAKSTTPKQETRGQAAREAPADNGEPEPPASETLTPPPATEPAASPAAVVEPAACVALERPKGTLEVVRDEKLEMPDRFSPDGRFAAVEGYGCLVWELDHEVYLGRFGSPRASGDCVVWPGSEDPCSDWPKRIDLEVRPSLPLDRTVSVDTLDLVFERGVLSARAQGVERFRSGSTERRYIAASLSPDRRYVALATETELDIIELADGKRVGVTTLSLTHPSPPGDELWSVDVTWSQGLPVVLSGRTPDCEPDDYCPDKLFEEDLVWELRRWTRLASSAVKAELVTWEDEDYPAAVYGASADPLGRWLWLEIDAGDAHDLPWELRQIPLAPEAESIELDLYAHGFDGEDDPGFNEFGIDDRAELSGSWVVGARTARAWSLRLSEYDGEGSGSDDLWWASMQLWPRPVRSDTHELASDYSVEEWDLELLGVRDGEALVAWSHCWPSENRESFKDLGYDYAEIGDDLCKGSQPVPSGCEARGVSERLDWLLVACGETWRLLPVGPAAAALEPSTLATAKDGPVTAVYGRSGLAIAGERTGLRLLAPDGSLRARAAKVTTLLPALLGAELDRVVGRSDAGLEVFDLETGKRVASLALELPDQAITHVAFAPDGRRLAWTDGRHLRVWQLDDGSTRRWDSGATVQGLAWRQDGAVLLTGVERALPERAWNPATGKLAAVQPDPRFLDRLAAADLDPSWRWAFEGEDIILRSLDGLALYLEHDVDDGCVVTETGLHGPCEHEPALVRIIGDDRPRVVPLSSLPARFEQPNLLADFLAGVALPEPRLDAAELAALD